MRGAGILMPISALPSAYGIGSFDEQAYRFVDFLASAGQSYWQILPLGPVSYGDSPYQSPSTFAGNPYYISIDQLCREGLLTDEECAHTRISSTEVDYEALYRTRYPLLRRAYSRSGFGNRDEHKRFVNENPWLYDYALFMAIKDNYGGRPWQQWDEGLKMRDPSALDAFRKEHNEDICFHQFLQYTFYSQWGRLRAYANVRGIRIMGDIPIYVALDSADVWASPRLFQLDENKIPIAVAGCPPDGFSSYGQLWGNPLYAWERHREDSYSWWRSRLRHCFEIYDAVRIDHFRGFDEYYSIPYGEKNARNGKWEKGPGAELFKIAEDNIGRREIIAEDLGFMTESVRQMVRDCGFPNMKVLQFAFDSRDEGGEGEHLPHNYGENCVAYTGTHDNHTLLGWYGAISEQEMAMLRNYICDHHTPLSELNKSLISLIMRSSARLCMIPMQDWLSLDDMARINTPGSSKGNWRWRMNADSLTASLAEEIRRLVTAYGRKEAENND